MHFSFFRITRGQSKLLAFSVTYLFISFSHAQKTNKYAVKDWQLMDLAKDSVYGTSVTKAYDELLKGKQSHPVVVAVIDAGVDTAHEDLVGHIWINKKEIPGNGIDDDKNGYVDDVHGWNFLGGKDGRNIEAESLESEREYFRLQQLYGNGNTSATSTSADFTEWQQLQKQHLEDSTKAAANVNRLTPVVSQFTQVNTEWKALLQKDMVTVANIKEYNKGTKSQVSDSATTFTIHYLAQRRIPDDTPIESIIGDINKFIQKQQELLSKSQTDPNTRRRDIVKDNPDDINDKYYGNNNVNAGTPTHGTHVSGIISATRNNNIGMNGIADNVQIMAIRAVPDGDERDKDIALAIRYAVDNGAKIINMSFGKPYSPGKKWVDEAVQYAAKKDVLLIHAAGNDGKNIDSTNDFPSPDFLDNKGKATNFLTIGASAGGPDSLLAASFSNYGARVVDFFSPGVSIYSSIPGNKYAFFNGTSMATPVVAGIAALILEYYPKLSAAQLKYVLESSVTPFPDKMVVRPGSKTKVAFGTLSSKGGIVNAYTALKLAATLKGKRKHK